MADTSRQRFRLIHETLTQLAAHGKRTACERLECQPARDSRWLAGVECHEKVTRAIVGSADHVDEREAARRRPAGVEAKQRIAIDILDAPWDELQPAPAQPR